jgi:hypothetical protein
MKFWILLIGFFIIISIQMSLELVSFQHGNVLITLV